MENSNMQLAPAAGAGIGKAIADALLAKPGFIDRMAAVIDRALVAKKQRWDRESKSFVEEDDSRIQLDAFFGVVAHMEGEPIKRIIHQHTGKGAGVDLVDYLQTSPAALDAVERIVSNAKFKTRNQKPVKTVEAELPPE